MILTSKEEKSESDLNLVVQNCNNTLKSQGYNEVIAWNKTPHCGSFMSYFITAMATMEGKTVTQDK